MRLACLLLNGAMPSISSLRSSDIDFIIFPDLARAENDIMHGPSGQGVSLLCQALFLLVDIPVGYKILIVANNTVPSIDGDCTRVLSKLDDEDNGWLYFPSVKEFLICAMDAIRSNNPLQGQAKLVDCWHQAILHNLAMVEPE